MTQGTYYDFTNMQYSFFYVAFRVRTWRAGTRHAPDPKMSSCAQCAHAHIAFEAFAGPLNTSRLMLVTAYCTVFLTKRWHH